jgi:hypothetical protein
VPCRGKRHAPAPQRPALGPLAGIYQAVNPQGQRVAIKVLPPVKAAEPGVLAKDV